MDNLVNIKANKKHLSLEAQIKKLDNHQDLTRSAVLKREIAAALKVQDWKVIRSKLNTIKILDNIPSVGTLHARYDEQDAKNLEKIIKKISADLKDEIKSLRTSYMILLLQTNYLSVLEKEALAVKSIIKQDDIDIPEMVKLLITMILKDKDCNELKLIRDLLIQWNNHI